MPLFRAEACECLAESFGLPHEGDGPRLPCRHCLSRASGLPGFAACACAGLAACPVEPRRPHDLEDPGQGGTSGIIRSETLVKPHERVLGHFIGIGIGQSLAAQPTPDTTPVARVEGSKSRCFAFKPGLEQLFVGRFDGASLQGKYVTAAERVTKADPTPNHGPQANIPQRD